MQVFITHFCKFVFIQGKNVGRMFNAEHDQSGKCWHWRGRGEVEDGMENRRHWLGGLPTLPLGGSLGNELTCLHPFLL